MTSSMASLRLNGAALPCFVQFGLKALRLHATELRCYMRDPDGYLIEVGQTTITKGPFDFLV